MLAVTPNTVDAPGQVITSQAPAERRPSGTRLSSLGPILCLSRGVGGTLRSLRQAMSWTRHQVAHNPLDSPFLLAYCVYLLSCFTLNILLNIL